MKLITNKRIFWFILLLCIVSFSVGLAIGTSKQGPYEIIHNVYRKIIPPAETEDNTDYSSYNETFVNSFIHIKNTDDISNQRKNLIQYIWSENDFLRDKLPSNVENNIDDTRYRDLSNLKRIDKITINMEYDVNSIAYLFLADKSNDKLVIYHQGHDGDFILGKNIIQYFLNHDYSVLAFSMPLLGMNDQSEVNLPNFGKLKLTSHDYLQFLESKNFSPIKFFVEPITVSLNYMDKNYGFGSYYMVGISGGGWTTVLYSAIDPRISKSYPIAGSVPTYLRFNNPKNMGDYEQMLPALYNITSYLDLYIMGSYGDGREQVQVFNKYDPCCFSGLGYQTYENEVKKTVSKLGKGKFEIFLDDTNKQHSISDKSLDIILRSMENNK